MTSIEFEGWNQVTNPEDPYGVQQPSGQQPMPYGQQPYPPPMQPGYGYGYPVGYQPLPQGMAVASLVCSLVGILFCLPAILGVIFGHIGYSKAKRGEAGGQGMALAGMIIGYVLLGLYLLIPAIMLLAGATVFGISGAR